MIPKYLCGAILLLTFVSQEGFAQPGRGETLISAVTRCRTITNVSDRVACYDLAADALSRASSNNELTIMSREEVTEKRRSLFGLSVDDGNLFGPKARAFAPIETLDSTVTRVVVAGRGVFSVVLADGSVWRTLEQARVDPAVGNSVHIRRGILNGYFGSFNGARGVRIERTR